MQPRARGLQYCDAEGLRERRVQEDAAAREDLCERGCQYSWCRIHIHVILYIWKERGRNEGGKREHTHIPHILVPHGPQQLDALLEHIFLAHLEEIVQLRAGAA